MKKQSRGQGVYDHLCAEEAVAPKRTAQECIGSTEFERRKASPSRECWPSSTARPQTNAARWCEPCSALPQLASCPKCPATETHVNFLVCSGAQDVSSAQPVISGCAPSHKPHRYHETLPAVRATDCAAVLMLQTQHESRASRE
jgi:hypothetical protein